MATCPRCGTELNGEFGMSQCSGCGAFSFIGDDGVARAPEEEASGAFNSDPSGNFVEEAPFAFDPVPSSIIDIPQSPENPMDGFGFDHASADDAPSEPAAESSSEVAPGSFDLAFGLPTDESNSESHSEPAPAPEPVQRKRAPESSASVRPSFAAREERDDREPMNFGPASDPLNLNEFANSEASAGRDGPLMFRVQLSGIDTKEIRDAIRDVLNDDRFRIDAAATMAKVSRGNLTIDGLSPVKASILVTRIKRLPIAIRWEQYSITQG